MSSDVIVEFPGVCVKLGARGCLHGSDGRVVARVLAFAGLVHALRQDRSHICPPLAGALLLSQDTPEQTTQSKFSLPQVNTVNTYFKLISEVSKFKLRHLYPWTNKNWSTAYSYINLKLANKLFHAKVNFMVIVFKITTILLELFSEYPTQGVHELSDTFWISFLGSIQTYFTT